MEIEKAKEAGWIVVSKEPLRFYKDNKLLTKLESGWSCCWSDEKMANFCNHRYYESLDIVLEKE